MSEKYTRPDGFCRQCGQPWWVEEHNHKKMGTLTPTEAFQAWTAKRLREQEDAIRADEDAAKSG